jgi:acyl-CoA thioesterase-1
MRNKKNLLRFGLVLLLAGVIFMGQGWRAPQPVRAAVAAKIKIMPLGDSITSGTPSWASYRCDLENLTGVANFDYVGSVYGQMGNGTQVNPPATCNNPNHSNWTMLDWDEEGHSGWRVDNILDGDPQRPQLGKLENWAPAYHPDIVLIHLGTVDFGYNESVSSTVAGIGQVIDTLRAANPWVRIVLAQIIPSNSSSYTSTAIPQFNAALPALVASKARPSSPILLVDQYTGFNVVSDTHDGTHPNESGEAKMAAKWKTAIDQIMAIVVVIYSTFIPQIIN